jgi:hypothetical protein
MLSLKVILQVLIKPKHLSTQVTLNVFAFQMNDLNVIRKVFPLYERAWTEFTFERFQLFMISCNVSFQFFILQNNIVTDDTASVIL